MSAKIDYTRQELTSLKSQIAAHQSALGALLMSVNQAEGLLNLRETLGEIPVRDNIEAKFAALTGAVGLINSMSLTVPSRVDFMAGYDAAEDPEKLG